MQSENQFLVMKNAFNLSSDTGQLHRGSTSYDESFFKALDAFLYFKQYKDLLIASDECFPKSQPRMVITDRFDRERPSLTFVSSERALKNLLSVTEDYEWEKLDTPQAPVCQYLKSLTGDDYGVYQSSKGKTTVISSPYPFTASSEFSKVLSAMPRLLPWLFENPTELELKLFQTMSEGKYKNSLKILDEIANEEHLNDILTNYFLNMTETYTNRQLVERLQSEIANLNIQINSLLESIGAKSIALQEDNRTLEAIQNEPKKELELAKFFSQRKCLSLVLGNGMRDGFFYYSIVETIEFYDPDLAEKVINNTKNYYSHLSTFAEITEIFKAVFIEGKGKFVTRSIFSCDRLLRINAVNQTSFDYEPTIYLPHPHIGRYNCLGGNELEISRYLARGDWQAAIDQTIAAAKNLNFSDMTVVQSFAEKISSLLVNDAKIKVILAENGTMMTVKEFYDYISSHEEEKVDE